MKPQDSTSTWTPILSDFLGRRIAAAHAHRLAVQAHASAAAQFGFSGDTAIRCSVRHRGRHGSCARSSGTRTPRYNGWWGGRIHDVSDTTCSPGHPAPRRCCIPRLYTRILIAMTGHPPVTPRHTNPLTNIGQILKRNHRTLILAGFHEQFIADTLKYLLEPSSLFSSSGLDVFMRPSRPVLMESAVPLFIFSPPVVELLACPERDY